MMYRKIITCIFGICYQGSNSAHRQCWRTKHISAIDAERPAETDDGFYTPNDGEIAFQNCCVGTGGQFPRMFLFREASRILYSQLLTRSIADPLTYAFFAAFDQPKVCVYFHSK